MKIRQLILLALLGFLFVLPQVRADNGVVIQNIVDSGVNVSSYIITSPQGVKVFVDAIALPTGMESEMDKEGNLMAVTHMHSDHYSGRITGGFKGQKLVNKAGVIVSGDVRVEGIESSHFDDDPDGTNFIFIIDVAGYRIAHFGDCGQAVLTDEQLKKIGHVDVAIAQFENSFSEANLATKKCYKLMAQVNPTIIIPTHIASNPAIKLINQTWPVEAAKNTSFMLNKELLDKGKRAIFIGTNATMATNAGMPVSKEF